MTLFSLKMNIEHEFMIYLIQIIQIVLLIFYQGEFSDKTSEELQFRCFP